MTNPIDIINETLVNLDQRTVQGIAAVEMVSYIVHQLLAINEAITNPPAPEETAICADELAAQETEAEVNDGNVE